MNGLHDLAQLGIDFFGRPGQAHRVLGHLKTGDRNAAGVRGLARREDDLLVQELDGLGRAAHVGGLDDHLAAVVNQLLGVFPGHLVLDGAREGDIALDFPGLVALDELGAELLGERLDDVVVGGAKHLHVVDAFHRQAVFSVDIAVRTGNGDELGAELDELLGSAPGDLAEAGDRDPLALDLLADFGEHVRAEIDRAEASGLRTDNGAAEREALAGEDADELVADTLVLAEEVADFTGADADIAGGDIRIGTDMLAKLRHEALAETHDLRVGLALGVEVGAALAAAHGKGGEGVLENLLEAEELHAAERDGRVETETALVGPDRRVELDAVSAIDVELALVVLPRDAEDDHALRLDQTLENGVLLVLGIDVQDGADGRQNLFDRLEKFRFIRILGFDIFQDPGCIFVHDDSHNGRTRPTPDE